MKKLLITLLFCGPIVISMASGQSKTNASDLSPSGPIISAKDFDLKAIPAANNTWGYDIYMNSKLLIHQPVIPGSAGVEGFKTKEGAEKIAQLVINKILNGELPPTVSLEEMEKLKLL